MHSYFTRTLFSLDADTVYVGLKAQTYHSSAGSIIGHTCAFGLGLSVHYSASGDRVVGYSIIQGSTDPAHPTIQLHKNAKGVTLGFTKTVAGSNTRLHLSADNQMVGVTHFDRDLGFQTHMNEHGVVLGQTRRMLAESTFTLMPHHLALPMAEMPSTSYVFP
jgi:hypothetical protein